MHSSEYVTSMFFISDSVVPKSPYDHPDTCSSRFVSQLPAVGAIIIYRSPLKAISSVVSSLFSLSSGGFCVNK